LYFRTGFFSSGDFAMGINELKQAGCNIIVDDVTFITEPFLKDGVVANAVDAAVAGGTTYFSAAGNFASKSYENTFNPVPAPGGITGTAHNFGGNDVYQNVNLTPGNYTIVLQWVDDIYSLGQTSAGGTKNDLDIYLTPNTDGTALFGFNRNNTNGDPIEILPFTLTSAVNTNILITNNTIGSSPARFKYIVFRGNITFNEYMTGTSTIVGQANALGAIAVGAASFGKTTPHSPIAIEPFSSTGGTFVNNLQRSKPDLVGPDGVNTTVNLGPTSDNDNFSNFLGTSAAAPHAAAVAALIMEGRKKFLNQATTTPAEIRAILRNSATDMNGAGTDLISGAGFINADSAMRTFAKPSPSIIQLVIPSAVVPGTAPFTLIVRGLNLSSTSVINFRGVPLPTTVLSNGEASALIPVFTGNPPINVYTPPISSSNLDGGYSKNSYFFDSVKKVITITAESKTKKYAEQLPEFTAKILVDNVPLANTTLTLADLGLSNLTFVTPATSNSNVGTYIITPVRTFDPANPVDVGLQETYTYTFPTGNLTIEKMPLLVTPVDKTITYGQHVGQINFSYQFDQSNVPDPAGVLNLIKAYHQAFLPGNALAVVKGGSALSDAELHNLNMMATFNAVKNSRKFQVENNKLVPVTDPNAFDIQYLVDVSVQSIVDYKANPATSSFINAVPGMSSKAVLGAAALDANKGKVLINGSLVQLVNGSLVQMVNSPSGQLAPISNGSLVQIVNGSLVQLVNGEPVAIPNGSLVQLVNGSLVQLVNGSLVQLVNGSLVQLVNGSLVQLENGSLVQLVNAQQVPIVNGSLVQLVNGSLVQLVNGVPVAIPNGSLVQLVNGSLVQLVNGSLVQLVNGSLVQLVNGSLVQLVNGSLVQIVNGNVLGTGTANNNTAVIIDESDVDLQTNWIGPMFGINMITGLDAGPQKLVPGVLVNENFEITYGTGTVNILPISVCITPAPCQSKVYGDADPVFTFTNNGGLTAAGFTGKLGRATGNNVGKYAYTIGSLSAGKNFSLTLAGTNTFAITPAKLHVKANDAVICSGDPLPNFTSTITGLKNGDKPSVSYKLSPVCVGQPGVYTIIPLLNPFANLMNYTVCYENGKLYINSKTSMLSRTASGPKTLQSPGQAVTEIVPADGANVYPNPARNRTVLSVSSELITQKGLSLFDAHGKSYPVGLVKQVSKHALEIDVSRLAGGVYFVRVKVENGYKTVSFIKE
ncbi:MAG: MBG domain-containing protein, partial [Ferruginibacter sp.]